MQKSSLWDALHNLTIMVWTGMSRRDSHLANNNHSIWLWIAPAIALLCPLHLSQTPGGVKFPCPYRNAWEVWRPFCSPLDAGLRDKFHLYIHTGLDMLFRNQWHNFTPGLAWYYKLPASISYTSSLFKIACRNAFQWRWPTVLEVILTCLPPPRPSCTEYFRLHGRSGIPTI